MAQLRAGKRGRRSTSVAAAYRVHQRLRRLRAGGWGLDPSLAAVASFATGDCCILRNPFPYYTATNGEHFVLWLNPGGDVEAAWRSLENGGAWPALASMDIAKTDATYVRVNKPEHRSIKHIPHAHVFIHTGLTDPAWLAAVASARSADDQIAAARPPPMPIVGALARSQPRARREEHGIWGGGTLEHSAAYVGTVPPPSLPPRCIHMRMPVRPARPDDPQQPT